MKKSFSPFLILLPNLTRHTFHKSIKRRMQSENLAKNSDKQFYVLINANQIKLYSYPDLLKENPLLRKFLNSESTAYFLDETFYHTHIPLFSTTISTAIVIKTTKYSTYSIIHITQQLNIQSSALKNVKLSYLVGSVDKNNVYFHMTCLLPKY